MKQVSMWFHNMAMIMVGLVPYVTSQEVDCSVFSAAACPLEESNIVGFDNEVTDTGDCQQR